MKNLIVSMALVSGLILNATPLERNSSYQPMNYEELSIVNNEVSAFCKLIKKGDLQSVKSMISAGVDINKKSVGMTPLMYAARHNRVEIVKLLIDKGVDLKIKSNRGHTALEYAEMSKATDAYKVISDHMYAKIKKKRVNTK